MLLSDATLLSDDTPLSDATFVFDAMLSYAVSLLFADFTTLNVRLMPGSSANSGRVEVYYNNTWGTICDDGFSQRDAAVICNSLGFNGYSLVIMSYTYSYGQHRNSKELLPLTPPLRPAGPSPFLSDTIIGGSCHKYHFCHDKGFVATNHVFCRDKSMLVATKQNVFLSRQT